MTNSEKRYVKGRRSNYRCYKWHIPSLFGDKSSPFPLVNARRRRHVFRMGVPFTNVGNFTSACCPHLRRRALMAIRFPHEGGP